MNFVLKLMNFVFIMMNFAVKWRGYTDLSLEPIERVQAEVRTLA